MMNFLFWLPDFITPANAAALEAAEEFATPIKIGFIVLGIIVGPVVVLTLAAIFGTPRMFRVPGLFIGSLILLVGAIISGFAIIGMLLKFVVPG